VLSMTQPVALIVARQASRREEIELCATTAGCRPVFAGVDSAPDACNGQVPDLVILVATSARPVREIECLSGLRASLRETKFLFVASVSSEDLAIAALHSGADRYIKEPWTPAALQIAIADLLPAAPQPAQDCEGLRHGDRFIGRSAASRQLRSQLARISPADSTVLITGETGTGKELVAELIHLNSRRADRPFVCVNMAALPDSLVENELFGHDRGAFTGAVAAQDGKLIAANGGTVFLDEIGDVSLPAQAKLLRAIENKSIYRVGGTRNVQLDMRIIAATNQNLERAADEGQFRSDLYYRLNVIRVRLPPLRERTEDIPLLINRYLRQFNREMGRSVRGLSPRAIETLCAYDWPGNVRELRNVIEALLANLAPETTGIVDVPPEIMRQLAFAVGAPTSERERLLQALTASNWNKSKAASQLHWSRMTLYRKMHQHNLDLRR
jgi:DNA-binding NtrC family response regulator